jgi:hypothetical protein
MTAQPNFQAEVYQNEYLPAGGRVVDAVITVTGSGQGLRDGAAVPTAAQVIIIDTSGSMGSPATKIAEAKKATAAAIDTLRGGVPFAVVGGIGRAYMVYPTDERMVPAMVQTRAAAKIAVSKLRADGGTAIGQWLALADRLFAGQEAEVKHAILLTDGKNEHESGEDLRRVLDACEGNFVCDSRGIGAGWVARELRMIASALLGTADGLEHVADLPAAFRSMTETAMGRAVVDVSLRVWTPAGATIRFVKQVFPEVLDLTSRRTAISARVGEYPTGAWGSESRDYHISVEVEAGAVDEERLVARISLVSGGQVLAEQLALAKWTDDTALSTKINPQVAHYTGQAELAAAIQEGLAAREAGDVEVATARLGRAVHLATESGHTDTAKLLARVVDVVDAEKGTIRLKKYVSGLDSEIADVRSVRTVRTRNSD